MRALVYLCMTKARRHALLKDILTRSPASTQEALVAGLTESGISVTQATVSRDLSTIGAVRGPDGYHLPSAPTAPTDTDRLRNTIQDHALRVVPAASIVVIHTAPGHANFLASEIDANRPDEMVGCIAGDDTIFIATPSNSAANKLAADISNTIGNTP